LPRNTENLLCPCEPPCTDLDARWWGGLGAGDRPSPRDPIPAAAPLSISSGERVVNPAFDNQADDVWGFEGARARLDLANGTWRGNGAAALGCPLPEEILMFNSTPATLNFGPVWDPNG
jgi:hypothetical protein